MPAVLIVNGDLPSLSAGTLAVEMQFYLLWPLLLAALLGRKGAPRRRATLVGIALVFMASLTVSIIGMVRDRDIPKRLEVERIDVVEPDGTPRMIVASRARFPGSFNDMQNMLRW